MNPAKKISSDFLPVAVRRATVTHWELPVCSAMLLPVCALVSRALEETNVISVCLLSTTSAVQAA